jgi:hypothetical protein
MQIINNNKNYHRKSPYVHEEFLVKGLCIAQQTLGMSDGLDNLLF